MYWESIKSAESPIAQSSQNHKKKDFVSREVSDSCSDGPSGFGKYVLWIIVILAFCGLVYFFVYFYKKYCCSHKLGYSTLDNSNNNYENNDEDVKNCSNTTTHP